MPEPAAPIALRLRSDSHHGLRLLLSPTRRTLQGNPTLRGRHAEGLPELLPYVRAIIRWPSAVVVLTTVATSALAQQQHPDFPLQQGATWTYRYPFVPDPQARAQSSETHKVVDVNASENTYTVEHTTRLGTLPPDRTTHV